MLKIAARAAMTSLLVAFLAPDVGEFVSKIALGMVVAVFAVEIARETARLTFKA